MFGFIYFLIRQIQRTTTEASSFTYHSRGVSIIVFRFNKRIVIESIVIYGHRTDVTFSKRNLASYAYTEPMTWFIKIFISITQLRQFYYYWIYKNKKKQQDRNNR